MGQVIQCLGGKTCDLDQISNKDATILYCLTNGVKVDYARIICEDIIHKLSKKTKEKVVPYPRRKQSSKHTSESKTEASKSKTSQSEKETQSSLTKDKSPSHPSSPTPVVGEMRKEAQPTAGGLTFLGATSEDRAHPQLSRHDASADSIAETDPGLSAPTDSIPSQQDQTKSVGDGLKTAKTDLDESEEKEADKEDTHDTSHDVPKYTSDELEQQKATVEAEVASLKARPSYPDINQLTDLLVTSLKPELSKLLASHNFASCLPTELKELPSKFTELFREIKELKQHVKDMEIKLSSDLKEIPKKLETFTSTISSLSSQVAKLRFIQWKLPSEFLYLPSHVSSVKEKLKALDSLPSLLNKVTKTLNRFATVVETILGATTTDVPSAGQAYASPAEGEKSTKDAETNLKDELVYRLGTNATETEEGLLEICYNYSLVDNSQAESFSSPLHEKIEYGCYHYVKSLSSKEITPNCPSNPPAIRKPVDQETPKRAIKNFLLLRILFSVLSPAMSMEVVFMPSKKVGRVRT
ncbi:hypothetical protein Tco_1100226 [Tanacetum coccineum]